VSGNMPTNQRSSQMREFAESKGLMTNARCLTEGVDLPAIDCVVFTDPKKSKVDIVQAAGRALRLSPGKKFGYILIPLIIPENENATEAAKDTAFEEIVATIRALATQDTRIIEYLRTVSSGAIPKGGSPIDGITKINVLTKVNEEEFNKSIQLKVWDRVAFGNWRPYEEAKKYAQSLKLTGHRDWFKFSKSKNFPVDIPKSVDTIYRKKWSNWREFLGTNFKSYLQVKKFAKSLKLNSRSQWRNYLKKNIIPKDIPSAPDQVYPNSFEGWGEFLGTGFIATKGRVYRNYKQAQTYVKFHKIKNIREWNLHIKSKKLPIDIPSNVNIAYRKKGWISWGDFFGTNEIATYLRKYRSYKKAEKYVQSCKLNSIKEWINFTKNKNFPVDLPKYPVRVYKKNWKTWGDFLGTGRVANKFKRFQSKKP
jgi:hypothetical protein